MSQFNWGKFAKLLSFIYTGEVPSKNRKHLRIFTSFKINLVWFAQNFIQKLDLCCSGLLWNTQNMSYTWSGVPMVH